MREVIRINNEELRAALLSRRPVVVEDKMHGGVKDGSKIIYSYVSAVIYRKGPDGNVKVSAELTDRSLHSVTVASPDAVSYYGGD